MPSQFGTLPERIQYQQDQVLQAISGLTALTDVLSKLDVASDVKSSPDRDNDAPTWWSGYYQKTLIAAAASLAHHANSEFDALTTLLQEQRRGEQ